MENQVAPFQKGALPGMLIPLRTSFAKQFLHAEHTVMPTTDGQADGQACDLRPELYFLGSLLFSVES
jgi:hypothetical protein